MKFLKKPLINTSNLSVPFLSDRNPDIRTFHCTNSLRKTAEITPVVTYDNIETQKAKVLQENKGKSGIYRLTNIVNKKTTTMNNNLNPWFITGFSDGESSFSVLFRKIPEMKTG
jgi:hypothetical protein